MVVVFAELVVLLGFIDPCRYRSIVVLPGVLAVGVIIVVDGLPIVLVIWRRVWRLMLRGPQSLVDIVIGRAKQVVGQYLHVEGIAELKGFGALCETPDCMKKDLDKSKKQVRESEISEALTRWYSQTRVLDEPIVIQNEVIVLSSVLGSSSS
ncbi:hypothetical protein BDZ89DRAFT_1135396 [Hymenopellis radicata]|nr:hypothetical protein BDZ89DRAFT_1135396 [Hymenopellis radicata]